MVFYVLTVVLSYSLYHLLTNTQAGTRFADQTRQALAFEQLRTQRTHSIVYAGGYFEIFETLRFVSACYVARAACCIAGKPWPIIWQTRHLICQTTRVAVSEGAGYSSSGSDRKRPGRSRVPYTTRKTSMLGDSG